MATEDTKSYASADQPNVHFRYPITYLQARAAVNELTRYFHLVTIDRGDELESRIVYHAPAIHTLIKDYDEKQRKRLLNREITKMQLIVMRLIYPVSVSPMHLREVNGEKKPVNVITEYYQIPKTEYRRLYNSIAHDVYQAIGLYERIMRQRKFDWFNPIYWVSRLINLPVSALRKAGVNVETERTYRMHYWILQALMGVLLTLAIIKLGLTTNLLNSIKDLF